MTQARKPFFSITSDIDDDAIERIARAKGVPELSAQLQPQPEPGAHAHPNPQRTRPEREGEAADPSLPSPSQLATPPSGADPLGPTPRADYIHVSACLPPYAADALKARALQDRVSINYLMMAALKQYGIAIRDVDLIPDGRRLRGSRTT